MERGAEPSDVASSRSGRGGATWCDRGAVTGDGSCRSTGTAADAEPVGKVIGASRGM